MDRLGYARYGAQGGDWGAQVATRIGALDPEHCVAHPPQHADRGPARGAGRAHRRRTRPISPRSQQFRREESGYALEQGTKPQTLGVALNDSPAGLLAWIVEKFRAWSDCDGDPENAFTRDQLLTNVMLYWVTRTITSSARLYREARLADAHGDAPQYVGVPTGVGALSRRRCCASRARGSSSSTT